MGFCIIKMTADDWGHYPCFSSFCFWQGYIKALPHVCISKYEDFLFLPELSFFKVYSVSKGGPEARVYFVYSWKRWKDGVSPMLTALKWIKQGKVMVNGAVFKGHYTGLNTLGGGGFVVSASSYST